MKRPIHAQGAQLIVRPGALFFFAVLYLLGSAATVTGGLLALLVHEASHALAGRALGCPIERLELAAYGGRALFANDIDPGTFRECAVALAGPLGNLLCYFLLRGVGTHIALFSQSPVAQSFLGSCVTLAVFNLLPALPLDGGRALRALCVQAGMSRRRADVLAGSLGAALGVLLCALGLWCGVLYGKVNLTLFLAGGCVAAGGISALRAPNQVSMPWRALSPGEVLPIRRIAVGEGMPCMRVLAKLRPGRFTEVTVLGHEGEILGEIDQNSLWEACAKGCITLGDAVKSPFTFMH